MSVIEGRSPGLPPARWSVAGIALILAIALTGVVWHREKVRGQFPAVIIARRYLTLELRLGGARTRALETLYRPFRALVAPRTEAADFTRWMIGETAAEPSGLRVTKAEWRPRRPVVVSAKGKLLAVQISYFWTRSFASRGRTGGMATARFTLVRERNGYRITSVGWNAAPSVSAAIDRTSFAYDLDWTRSLPTPPMGMPPPLKPRVNNP